VPFRERTFAFGAKLVRALRGTADVGHRAATTFTVFVWLFLLDALRPA